MGLPSVVKSPRLRVLIAPDKFKGSLTSPEVAAALARGLASALPKAKIAALPLADGGDGFVPIVTAALGGRLLKARSIPDALGRPRTVAYGWAARSRTAVLDVAGVCGIAALKAGELDPLSASTRGLGLLARRMLKQGAKEILIGLGGSATNDGGMGFASGLGYRFLDRDGKRLYPSGGALARIARIVPPASLPACRFRAAVDVTNPLLGKAGATAVFGPQKGATARTLPLLEKGMKTLAAVAGTEAATLPGAGAAGGLGYGLATFAGAQLENGFHLIAALTGLEKEIARADIVVTGEGCLDPQTDGGKVPEGVRRLAAAQGKPVYAFVGRTKGKVRGGYAGVFALLDIAADSRQAIAEAGPLLARLAAERGHRLVAE